MLQFEQALWAEGKRLVCGVDEAGRGPLAGPVTAAAVILNPDDIIDGVNDSKVSLENKNAEVEYDEDKIDLDDIKQAIEDAGFEVKE